MESSIPSSNFNRALHGVFHDANVGLQNMYVLWIVSIQGHYGRVVKHMIHGRDEINFITTMRAEYSPPRQLYHTLVSSSNRHFHPLFMTLFYVPCSECHLHNTSRITLHSSLSWSPLYTSPHDIPCSTQNSILLKIAILLTALSCYNITSAYLHPILVTTPTVVVVYLFHNQITYSLTSLFPRYGH